MGYFVICIFLCEYPIKTFYILNFYEIGIDASNEPHLHHLVRYKYPLHHFSEKNDLFLKIKKINENFKFNGNTGSPYIWYDILLFYSISLQSM
jgi:hypothetical protein